MKKIDAIADEIQDFLKGYGFNSDDFYVYSRTDTELGIDVEGVPESEVISCLNRLHAWGIDADMYDHFIDITVDPDDDRWQVNESILSAILSGKSVRRAVMESSSKIDIVKLEKELKKVLYDFMTSEGFEDNEVDKYSHVQITKENGDIVVHVGAELSYDGCMDLSDRLDKVISKYDKGAYFDMEDAGLMVAVL